MYKYKPDKFDIGQCQIKVKVTEGLKMFSTFTTIRTDRAYYSTRMLGRSLEAYVRHVCSSDYNKQNISMPSWLNDFAYVVRQKPIDFGAN